MMVIYRVDDDLHTFEKVFVDIMQIESIEPHYYFGDRMIVKYKDGTSDIINKIAFE